MLSSILMSPWHPKFNENNTEFLLSSFKHASLSGFLISSANAANTDTVFHFNHLDIIFDFSLPFILNIQSMKKTCWISFKCIPNPTLYLLLCYYLSWSYHHFSLGLLKLPLTEIIISALYAHSHLNIVHKAQPQQFFQNEVTSGY